MFEIRKHRQVFTWLKNRINLVCFMMFCRFAIFCSFIVHAYIKNCKISICTRESPNLINLACFMMFCRIAVYLCLFMLTLEMDNVNVRAKVSKSYWCLFPTCSHSLNIGDGRRWILCAHWTKESKESQWLLFLSSLYKRLPIYCLFLWIWSFYLSLIHFNDFKSLQLFVNNVDSLLFLTHWALKFDWKWEH